MTTSGNCEPVLTESVADIPRYLTSGDASRVLAVSPQWVLELHQKGDLRAVAYTTKRLPRGGVKVFPLYEEKAVLDLRDRRAGIGPRQLPLRVVGGRA